MRLRPRPRPRPWPSLHQVTIGRTREVRGPDAMERLAAGAIITVAMAMAVWFGVHTIHMAQTLDAVGLASGVKVDQTVYYATHGRWASSNTPNLPNGTAHGPYVTRFIPGGHGVITAQMSLGPASPFARSAFSVAKFAHTSGVIHGYLSFRPEMLGSPDTPIFTYLCGYAKPVIGATATVAAGHTTLSRKDLPPFCR